MKHKVIFYFINLKFYFIFILSLFGYKLGFSQIEFNPNYKDPNPLDIIYSNYIPKNLKNIKKEIFINLNGDTISKIIYLKNGKKDEYYYYSSNKIYRKTKYYYSKNSFDTIKKVEYDNENRQTYYGVEYFDKFGNLIKYESSYTGSEVNITNYFYDKENNRVKSSNTKNSSEYDIIINYNLNKPIEVKSKNKKINFKYNNLFLIEERIDYLNNEEIFSKKFEYKDNFISKITEKFSNKTSITMFEYESKFLTKVNYYNEYKEECTLKYNNKGLLTSILIKLDKNAKSWFLFPQLSSLYWGKENFRIDFIYDNLNNILEKRYYNLENPKVYRFDKYIYEYY
jgi:hypothetical protein